MDVTAENDRKRDKRSFWDRRTPFQKNLIVGVISAGILVSLIIPLIMYSGNSTDEGQLEEQNGDGVKVIIIGAGAAGIAAAAELLENNITDVIILEAEDRIGGRIYSTQFGDAVVDLGAQWCHGQENNIVYELVKDLDLLEEDSLVNFAVYHSSQKFVDLRFVKQLSQIGEDIYSNENKTGVEHSLGEFFVHKFNTTIVENYGSNPKRISFAQDFLNHYHLQLLTNEGAFSWYDVAADSTYENSEGPYNLGWKDRGYKTILDVLTKKYPNPSEELPVYEKVTLNKDVIKISIDEGMPTVECSDNTTYTANHVIWTPSLGVLKHRYEQLFEPNLPKDKVNAIESLGIGAVMKIFFYFPVRWWPKHVDGFSFIWGKRDGQNVWREFPYGTKTQGKSWLLGIANMLVNRYNPNVLTAWVSGEAVITVEKLSDDIIINGTMFLLQKFLGHHFHNITRPQKILRQNWYSSDHFRGTYSYDTVESFAEPDSQRHILSMPLESNTGKPVVLFAGEATNVIHFASVHGAIETGRREADRIINYYKEN